MGGILYTLRPTGVRFNHYNRRGDMVIQMDPSETTTFAAQYKAFGDRSETGSSADRQRSNSKDEDVPGYANEGFRFRDIETGAFISRDPAGFVDGPNLYTYVVQNPWTKFDARGLRAQNKNEKKALAAMREVEKSVRETADGWDKLADDSRIVGDTIEANKRTESAKIERQRADNLAKAISGIEKMIADSPSAAQDSKALKALGAAFDKWMDPQLQASYAKNSRGGNRTDSRFVNSYKCNVFLFDCLAEAGYSPQNLLHPGTKNPALAGRWNDPRFSPAGLSVQDTQIYDEVTDTWTSQTGGAGVTTAGQVVTYGQPNAIAAHAHATISLGHGWLINATDTADYNQSAGVNIKPDGVAGSEYGVRTVRNPN